MKKQSSDSDNKMYDIYQDVTRKIVLSLSKGEIPWKKRWCSPVSVKLNYASRRSYTGINLLLLQDTGEYMTFKQCSEAGGHIKEGEHSHKIYQFVPIVPRKNKEEYERLKKLGEDTRHLTIPSFRYNNVFHISQTEGLKTKFESPEHEDARKPVDKADFIIADFCGKSGIVIQEKQTDTFNYDRAANTITIPQKSQFHTEEQWYSTVFSGLTRSLSDPDGEDDESSLKNKAVRDELTSEIAACMVMSGVELTIPQTQEDTLAECGRWIKELNNDYKLIVCAAQRASHMAEEILKPII